MINSCSLLRSSWVFDKSRGYLCSVADRKNSMNNSSKLFILQPNEGGAAGFALYLYGIDASGQRGKGEVVGQLTGRENGLIDLTA